MPYTSDRQRRFFHTETARKHGITPAMVREYDEASRGKNLPAKAETAEKKAEGGASDGATSGVSTTVSAPKPPDASSGAPKYKSETAQGGPLRLPWPGDYKQNFLEASASAAQRSTADKFEGGERTNMPVTR